MNIQIRELTPADLPEAISIWNQVVEDGIAFPQMDCLDPEKGAAFFGAQSFAAVAQEKESGAILGLYILHPNNVGRCGHICNASYAVRRDVRGMHIGEQMILHCLSKGKALGFRILQFNAVVKTNPALYLYKKAGFVELGTIPGGFLMKDGHYEDIVLLYHLL